MINKIKKIIAAASVILLLTLAGGSAVVMAQQENRDANIQEQTCQGARLAFTSSNNPGQCDNEGEEEVNSLIATIVNIFSVVVGIVAVIMIIIGGFRYITSGGDSGNVTAAKNTILYAIVGLVIVALAQFIVKFVLAKATQN